VGLVEAQAERVEGMDINAFGEARLVADQPLQLRLQRVGQLLTEWQQVVDAWQLQSWEGYRDVARLGRKTRLP
jgi:hypothetical protein